MEKTKSLPDWTKVSEVELVYHAKIKASLRPKITSSQDIADLLQAHWDRSKIELLEDFKVILLSQSNRVLGIVSLSRGGVTGTVADPRLIFCAALKAAAVSLILAHSHPSGNLKPSKADEDLTYKVQAAARLFDMKLLDHIILTAEGYFSFADNGIL